MGDNGKLLIALAVVLAIVFAFVVSNVAANHAPKPHDLPVGVVGPTAVVQTTTSQLESSAPGAFDVTAYGSSAAAETGISHRSVYGAFEPGSQPTLLIATAASSQHLPPGAGVTAMRNVVYFDGHGASRALIVLGVYAIVGAAAAILVSTLRARQRPALAPA